MNYPKIEYKANASSPTPTSPVSSYSPSPEAAARTAQVMKDYVHAYDWMNKPLMEYNGRSVLQEINANQKSFNSYVPPKSEDPDESWRAQTVRPIVRNKLISIAAHVTAQILYPAIFAQDPNDDEDKAVSEVMRDCIEWIIDNSNYQKSFLLAVISALVDPALVVKQEYVEVVRKVKRKQADGSYQVEDLVDELLSGFHTNVVPLSEMLFANLYQPELQKQRFIIRQRKIDYQEAYLIHGKMPNWKYVTPGTYAVFEPSFATFYDTFDKDDELMNLVHEVTYYSKFEDLELTFVNGILLCDPEYPMQRYDKLYPFALSGYEPINNGQFLFYKSAANKLGPDEDLVNTLYNMVMDGTFMSLMPPMALYGDEEVTTSVMVPGSITSFRTESKLDTIGPKSDLRAGLMAIEEVEKSISESSQDNSRAGVAGGGPEQTAYQVRTLEENARTQLGLFGKFIGFLVQDIGRLQVGDVLQHMAVADIRSISGGGPMKYKSILLPDKSMDGKKVTKKIDFNGMNPYEEGSEKTETDRSFDILEKEGGMDGEVRIYQINPELFRQYKYKVTVSTDKLETKSKALERALNLELYDRAIRNPLANQEAVLRDFLFEIYKPGESAKYVGRPEQRAPMSPDGEPMVPPEINSNLPGQLTGSNSLKTAMSIGE